MAITQTGSTLVFDSISTINTGTVSTTITVPADAQIVLVGSSSYSSATAGFFSGGSVTFTKGAADTAMTAVTGGDASTSFWMASMWYLNAPDTGANKSLKWDWSGTGTADVNVMFAVTFWKGIDTASPVRDARGAQAGSLPYTTPTLTAVSGDLIVAFCGTFAGTEATIDSWSNLTLLTQQTVTGSSVDGAWATGSPSGNTTVAASTGTNWGDGGILAVVLKAASGGGSTTTLDATTSGSYAVTGTVVTDKFTLTAGQAGA